MYCWMNNLMYIKLQHFFYFMFQWFYYPSREGEKGKTATQCAPGGQQHRSESGVSVPKNCHCVYDVIWDRLTLFIGILHLVSVVQALLTLKDMPTANRNGERKLEAGCHHPSHVQLQDHVSKCLFCRDSPSVLAMWWHQVAFDKETVG